MNGKLIVTLNDGTKEESSLHPSSYGREWTFRVSDGVLRVFQDRDVTTYPLTSVVKWETSS